jgi:hypothetical protein
VEVVEITRFGTEAGNGFPADRDDFRRNLGLAEKIFGFFDPRRIDAGMRCGV